MKYTVLTCLSICLILCSCTNGLDLYPTDKISSNKFWKTADDALKGVNATYQYVFPESDEYGMDLFFYESASDNSYNQHSNQFGNFQQIMQLLKKCGICVMNVSVNVMNLWRT